ncbi:winged helix-turn-helix transcriptional regulator [Ferrovibrio sp.]|uniref:winged helix-turn-helix transcriptional regulator n=1 Tax=Ferrovibrio sp. TaxID=1917215 RepID=UPI001B3ED08F|nr:winged helix-turn-helix transcriptional regulator [Ferrovibrio sp.]MBP7063432.1 winged helix-turn-helix transcriptional regulator [Ferrovibrio sp.]
MADERHLRETLDLLDAVEQTGNANQKSLAQRVGVAVGLLNALLRRAVHKGYIKVSEAPARRFAYYLTPQGFTEKSRLVSQYLSDSLHFFRQSRSEYNDLMQPLAGLVGRRVFLAGIGELAEIAMLSAQEAGLPLAGLIDTKTNRQTIQTLPVLRDLNDLRPDDLVIIADAAEPQATYDRLAARLAAEQLLHPPLLRIATRPPATS